jgi:hypothetical protein
MLDPWMLRQKFLYRCLLNLPLLFPVDLVAHKDEGKLFWLLGRSLVQELTDPRLDVIEGLTHAMSTRLLVIS